MIMERRAWMIDERNRWKEIHHSLICRRLGYILNYFIGFSLWSSSLNSFLLAQTVFYVVFVSHFFFWFTIFIGLDYRFGVASLTEPPCSLVKTFNLRENIISLQKHECMNFHVITWNIIADFKLKKRRISFSQRFPWSIFFNFFFLTRSMWTVRSTPICEMTLIVQLRQLFSYTLDVIQTRLET